MTTKNKTTLFGLFQLFTGVALMLSVLMNTMYLSLFFILLTTGLAVYVSLFKEEKSDEPEQNIKDQNDKLYEIIEIEDYKELSFYKDGLVVSNHGEEFKIKAGRKGVLISCYFNEKTANELRKNNPITSSCVWNSPARNTDWLLGWTHFVHFFGDYKHEILMKANPEYREDYNARMQLKQELNEEDGYEENYNLLR